VLVWPIGSPAAAKGPLHAADGASTVDQRLSVRFSSGGRTMRCPAHDDRHL